MKTIFRQGLLASVIAASGLVVSATGAFAQAAPANGDVNFTGTVGSVCTFSNMSNGTLAGNGGRLESADPFVGAPAPGSAVGNIDVDCTGDVIISVGLPQDNGSTTDLLPTAAGYGTVVADSNSNFIAAHDMFGGTINEIPSGTLFGPYNETLSVGMFIDAGFVPEGAYNYNVVVTATPQ